MATIHHSQHFRDRLAMLAMRGIIALQGAPSLVPEARPGFDKLMARTPAAQDVSYEPGEVGGVSGWWCRPALRGEDVLLYFHGGAYVLGSSAAYRHLGGQIAARARMPAFVADYSLAPERPFPAATDDVLAAYRGLAQLGHLRIALAGDSGGGGLALSLLATVSRSAGVPRPLGALAFSPWTDLALTGASIEGRSRVDPMLRREALDGAAKLYLGKHDRRAPEASPIYGELSDLPPVQIHVGENEILLDDALRYAHRLEAAGGEVGVHVWQGMAHVFPAGVGSLRAAGEALDLAGAFLSAL